MELFWKTSATILISVILILTLGKQAQDISILLTIAVCCMTGMVVVQMMEPVLDFLYEIQSLAYMEGSILKILFKLVGVALTAEIVALICADAGSASLGKSIQILASSVILYLSIPIFEKMVDMIRDIMGGL